MQQQKTADQPSSIEISHCHAVVIPQLSRTSVDFYCRQPADRHDCIKTVHVICFAVHVMFDGACLIKDFRDVNYVIIIVCAQGNFWETLECDVKTVLYRMVKKNVS